jgi:hypothetical protein
VLALVRVLEKVGTLTGSVCSQRLEGSRFGLYPATLAAFVSSLIGQKRVKTGGSRERLIGSQLYGPIVNGLKPTSIASLWVVPGSRPLQHSLVGWTLKRISRGRVLHAKAAPLQALAANGFRQGAAPSEEEDDDEDDYDS